MLKYAVKRVFMLIPVLIGITLMVYLILSLTPVDPVKIVLGVGEFTAEDYEMTKEWLGLNDPLLVRYGKYLANVARGDFGTSWYNGYNVGTEFARRFPYSLKIGIYANIISIIIGIPFGIIAGVRHNKASDYIATVVSLLLVSAPSFWVGMLGQLYLAVRLNLLPVAGSDTFKHYILPSFVGAGAMLASNMRTTRTWLVDVIRSDYVRTARAKGAHEFTVIVKHALRNALLPVITTLGMNFAMILGAVTIIETVFAIPGASSFLISACRVGDVPIVMGCIVVVAVFVGAINLVIDLIYALVDPRVSYG